jgi:hypothetical protein
MGARNDVQYRLFAGDFCHHKGDARIQVADNEADVIAFDQLAGFLRADGGAVRGVFDQQFDRSSENSALPVDHVGGEFGSGDFAGGQRTVNTGQGIDHADPDRRLAASLNEVGRRELYGGQSCARPQDSASIGHAALSDLLLRAFCECSRSA